MQVFSIDGLDPIFSIAQIDISIEEDINAFFQVPFIIYFGFVNDLQPLTASFSLTTVTMFTPIS